MATCDGCGAPHAPYTQPASAGLITGYPHMQRSLKLCMRCLGGGPFHLDKEAKPEVASTISADEFDELFGKVE